MYIICIKLTNYIIMCDIESVTNYVYGKENLQIILDYTIPLSSTPPKTSIVY